MMVGVESNQPKKNEEIRTIKVVERQQTNQPARLSRLPVAA
jgi:hypothetical protein